MPRPRLTDKEITAMRERILDAAIGILREEGPAGLSIRAIADQVGVSHMVLYSYFENRDEMFAALRERQHQRMQDRHADALARARQGNVTSVVREILEGYVSFAHKNPHVFRFLWCAPPGHVPSHRRHGLPDHPREGFQEELDHLADLIRLGIERGAFVERDPATAALMVTGMINGPLVMYLLPGIVDEDTLYQLERETVQAGLSYLTGQEC